MNTRHWWTRALVTASLGAAVLLAGCIETASQADAPESPPLAAATAGPATAVAAAPESTSTVAAPTPASTSAVATATAASPAAVAAATAARTSTAPALAAPAPTPAAAETQVAATARPSAAPAASTNREATLQEYPVPAGSHPHDVAPAPDGTVWYTAQAIGELGRLDPASGAVDSVKLGRGSSPHGVIVGPDGAAWVTDSGLNAIVRVDPQTLAVQSFPLPGSARANLNTATFDGRGVLWFTGQNGYYGSLEPASGKIEVFEAPQGRGPYGIHTAPDGSVYYASLAGSHIARIDVTSGAATVLNPPTAGQGARRVWADSQGRIWVSEWNAGQLGMYDPAADSWREWALPGTRGLPYAVYVDERDQVWVSDFAANALWRFDPQTEQFEDFPLPSPSAHVRQLLGRPGEVWGAESGADKLVVIRY